MQEPHSRASSYRAHAVGIAISRRSGLRAWFAASYLTLGLALAFSSPSSLYEFAVHRCGRFVGLAFAVAERDLRHCQKVAQMVEPRRH